MPSYRERLVPGPWALSVTLLLAPAALLIMLPISLPIGILGAVVLPVGSILFLIFSAPIVEVRDGVFAAGRAQIETALLGTPEIFRGSKARAARGVDLDARAWTVFRGWVDPVVRIPLLDPDDPTPYWLVSTRRPEDLAAAISARVARA